MAAGDKSGREVPYADTLPGGDTAGAALAPAVADDPNPISARGAAVVGLIWLTIALLRGLARLLLSHTAEKPVDPVRGRALVHRVERLLALLAEPIPRALQRIPVSVTPVSDAPVPSVMFSSGKLNPGQAPIFYIHGGSYCLERGPLHDVLARQLVKSCDRPVCAVDYRLAPEDPFPAAVEDVVEMYAWLAARHGDEQLVVLGDSAGAGLALAQVQRLIKSGQSVPAGLCLLCPWADLTFSGPSIISNAGRDPFMTNLDAITVFAEMYLAGHSPRDPLVSAVYGEFDGFPPTLIHAGSSDVLRSDAERVAAGLRAASVPVRFEVWERMPHVWQRLGGMTPEVAESLQQVGTFVTQVLTQDRAA